MKELLATIHIHSTYSDGSKTPKEITKIAAEAGVDIIMITDHNVYPIGFEDYYTYGNSKVMLLVGEEIHDQNRQPQKNHLLALGIDHDYSRLAEDPQNLIDQLNKADALSFIAHAYDPALPMIGEADLSWVDWSIKDFTGLELWNNLSEFKIRAKKIWHPLFFAFFPKFMAYEAPIQIRNIWDSFLQKGERMVAIAGVDAHQLSYHVGPFTKEVFPYSYHFKTIRNHLLIPSELCGEIRKDRKVVVDAMRDGHLFIANDMVKPAKGFEFYLESAGKNVIMGDSVPFESGQELTVRLPYPAKCRLIRDGGILDERKIESSHAWKIDKPGAYRLECYRRYLGLKRGWIFSNPVYVTQN